jgi:hypothetical protein
MNTIIIKFGSILPKDVKDRIKEEVTASLEDGVLILDDACSYEVVNLERGKNNDKK